MNVKSLQNSQNKEAAAYLQSPSCDIPAFLKAELVTYDKAALGRAKESLLAIYKDQDKYPISGNINVLVLGNMQQSKDFENWLLHMHYSDFEILCSVVFKYGFYIFGELPSEFLDVFKCAFCNYDVKRDIRERQLESLNEAIVKHRERMSSNPQNLPQGFRPIADHGTVMQIKKLFEQSLYLPIWRSHSKMIWALIVAIFACVVFLVINKFK